MALSFPRKREIQWRRGSLDARVRGHHKLRFKQGQAAADAKVDCSFDKGLKVEAVRKAPMPIAQKPT
jgi:hypothetical protein